MSSVKDSQVRPGEALVDALEEVRNLRGPVKRLVLVAGQLQREAWQDQVADRDGKDAGAPAGLFHEARFRTAWAEARETWAAIEGGTDRAATDPPGTLEPADPAGSEEPTDPEGPEPNADPAGPGDEPRSRADAFVRALLAGAKTEEKQPILLAELDPDLQDPVAAGDQTDALRHLVEHDGRSLVILSDTVPAREPEHLVESPAAEEARRRWVQLLGAFPVRYVRDTRFVPGFRKRLAAIARRLGNVAAGDLAAPALNKVEHWYRIADTIHEECRHTPVLQQLSEQLLNEFFVDLGRDRFLQEIEDHEKAIERLDEELQFLEEVRRLEGELRDAGDEEELDRVAKAIAQLGGGARRAAKDAEGASDGATAPEGGESAASERDRGRVWPEGYDPLAALADALEERRVALLGGGPGLAKTDAEKAGLLRAGTRRALRTKRRERAAAAQDLKGWKFRLQRLEESHGSDSYRTLLTAEHVVTRVGAEARLHYRFLWSRCTRDQRLVLVQLAHHGLVNPKYDGWALDLMQKGLIVRDPDIRLMNRSFERFVRQETRRSQILEWQEELGPNAWGVLKWILPFPLLALAGFLFITQRDAVSNAAGVLVALASLTPVVFNLYEKFQEINLRHGRADGEGDEAEA